ncbi:MAG: hypothetical protein MnENMB40S_33580 [Rhizobiaceae bacterium MnEN-MB40S]|nr:MAG: hypothetical protein MnENMB40S_33580 [Rhizobiaceae bacterium MnEN-MB40S]
MSRDRIKMVSALLRSLAALDTGPDFTFSIVLVENGDEGILQSVADEFRQYAPGIDIEYLKEPVIGVASARNCALNYAIDAGFDKLAFVDDDEIVRPSWISNLYRSMKRRNLDLVGGPVIPFAKDPPDGIIETVILRNLLARSSRIQRVSRYLETRDRDGSIMLATNNWMTDLDFCRKNNLRFDIIYNLTGGEDSGFFYAAKRAGAKTGWCTQAFVDEEVPAVRLTVGYQFRRSRDQSLVSFRRKYKKRPYLKWLIIPIGSLYKFVAGLLLLILAPFTLGKTLLSSIRALGQALGRIFGLFGYHTFHYEKTTGY